MNQIMLPALLVTACLALGGCGSSTRVVQDNETCGKQMTDLQNALASGAMTPSEYDRAHHAAMKRCANRDHY